MTSRGVGARLAVVAALACASLAHARPSCAQTEAPRQPPSTPSSAESPGGPAASAPSSLASDPDRVRRALARPTTGLFEASTATRETDGLTFRVTITQKPFNIWEFWGPPETAVAPYVRSWYFSAWHAEYLRMVTPEYGRRAALYPQGMLPIMPAVQALTGAIKDAMRSRAERQAKQEVREALEQFFAEHPEARAPAPVPPEKSPVP